MNNDNFYVVKNDRSIEFLPEWLKERPFTYFNKNLKDKNGDTLIGLFWNDDLKSIKKGLVLVKNRELFRDSLDILLEYKHELGGNDGTGETTD